MPKGKIATQAAALCEQIILDLGYDLVDIEYIKEGSAWFLRFYIDKKGGIGLDDCSSVSQTIDPIIEENIEIPQAYFLEVSSPGLERPLKNQKDFLRHIGEEVEVTLYQARQGQKKFTGNIVAVDEANNLQIRSNTSEDIWEFTEAERAKVKRVITFA